MAKVYGSGKLPKKIDEYILYPLNGESIIRLKSGFTTAKLANDPKYEKSRNNASEFGRVSSLCKEMRLALEGILPRKNNLAVCNSLVKQMRSLLCYDSVSPRGQRHLVRAFEVAAARNLMEGYNFNPDGLFSNVLKKHFLLNDGGHLLLSDLNVTDAISFPDGSNSLGIRLHHLDFDFSDGSSTLCSSDWLFLKEDSVVDTLVLPCGFSENRVGVLFSILEVQFFGFDGSDFVEMDEVGKMVCVLGCY